MMIKVLVYDDNRGRLEGLQLLINQSNDMTCIIKLPGRSADRTAASRDERKKVKRFEIGLNFML